MFLESDKAHCVILFKYYYMNTKQSRSLFKRSEKKELFWNVPGQKYLLLPDRTVPGGGGAEPVGAAGLNGHAHHTLLTLPVQYVIL